MTQQEIKELVQYWKERLSDYSIRFMFYNDGDVVDMKPENWFNEATDAMLIRVAEAADYTELDIEKMLGLENQGYEEGDLEDAGWEYKNGDNSYNWSYFLPDLNFGYWETPEGKWIGEVKVHLGGDVRGNYSANYYFEEDSEYDLHERLDELWRGAVDVELFFDDGSSLAFASQQETDVPYFESNPMAPLKDGTLAKEFEMEFDSLQPNDADELVAGLTNWW